ncbi:MAG: hypothetical protein U9O94_07755 [Nanoarchaeota archaeon]|nr:hypothetical protein [Nanoarchaeota archaeon]
MKLPLSFLILVLVLPFSYASMEITSQLEGEYNLGDEIPLSITIIPEETTNSLIKSTMKCTNRYVTYDVKQFKIKEGEEVKIDVPTIAIFEGACNIRINVDSLLEGPIEGISTKDFTVSNRLELSFSVDKTEALPGEKIKIEGTAKRKKGSIDDGIIKIRFNGMEEEMNLRRTDFSYTIELGDDIKSGQHQIDVMVKDSSENFNQQSKTINVKVVPTTLEFDIVQDKIKPIDTLTLTVILLDQAEDPIDASINLKLYKKKTIFSKEIVLFDKNIQSNLESDFSFEQDTAPNKYILEAVYYELEEKETIEILPYSEISATLEGNKLLIKNIGNVKFKNKTTIILQSDGKTYILDKRISLDIGEGSEIDLSKEVPSGNYKITSSKKNQETGEIVEKEVVGTAQIEDNRPVYKKGMQAITGNAVKVEGTGRGKIASVTLVLIILSVIAYFNRKRLKKIIGKIIEIRERRY